MKIGFITYEYPPDTGKGGIGTYTLQVAHLLQINNFEIHVFAGSNTRSGLSIEDGILVHRVKCSDSADFRSRVLSFFSQEHAKASFDLIESPEINANAIEIKNRFPAIPLLVRLHAPNYLVESMKKKYMPVTNKWRFFLGALKRGKWDTGYWKKYKPGDDIDFNFVQHAEYISAPTEQMKDWAVKNWQLSPALITVIPNPFAADNFFKNAITDNSQKAIIFFGRLNILKGLHTATLAMKTILENNPDWQWIIVGDDGPGIDGKSSMQQWMHCQLMKVKGQVFFHSGMEHHEIPGFLKKASIVLVPSLFESYSYVTIEAMSAGKAVIGSKGTGIAALIEEGKSGMLADPYKVKQWRQTIQQLIGNITLRKALGRNAVEYVQNKTGVNNQLIGFYHGILKRNNQN